MPKSFTKQPVSNLDYDFDWQRWLEPTAGDVISIADVIADPGITLGTKQSTATRVKQFISGGTSGSDYKVSCTITTVQGRIEQKEIKILVRET